MASLLLGTPNSLPTDSNDVKGKKKKIPKVAVYVAGAAFAITTGLTVLVIPYVRQAAKLSNSTQFLSHQSLAILNSRANIARVAASASNTTQRSGQGINDSLPSGSSTISSTQLSSSSTSHPASFASTSSISTKQLSEETIDPALLAARAFNAREEKSLYGSSLTPAEGEESSQGPASGLMGFYALGIATALVWGSAGLGAFIVAKLLGVKDMAEFSTKMRESMNLSMPALVESVNQPGRSIDGFDGEAIEQWVAKLEKEDEEEENRQRPS